MALTSSEIKQIKISIGEVMEPKFSHVNLRFDEANKHFLRIKEDLDQLATVTNRKFQIAFTDIAVLKEDIGAVKTLVEQHGYRLAQLENQDRIEL